MKLMNQRKHTAFSVLFCAAVFAATLPLAHCTATNPRMEAAQFQSTEIGGLITVATEDGKKVARITTSDGKVYTITGKLDRMIRDFYKGQTIRVAGKVETEPQGSTAGSFRVEEIILDIR